MVIATSEQIKFFLIGCLITTIFYIILYSKKGTNKSVFGYIQALSHCFSYSIMTIFLIVGIKLINLSIEQSIYPALIIPIVWFFIVYINVKNCLNNDFNLNIHIFNIDKTITSKIMENFILMFFFAITLFMTIMIFFQVLPDTENHAQGTIPILIVGIILLLVTIIFGKIVLNKVFRLNIKISLKNVGIATIVLFGFLFFWLGAKDQIEYKQKEKEFIETKGKFITVEEDENSDEGTTYFLIYEYEVDGKKYTVSTNYSTAFIPDEGSEETILYNIKNHSDSVIKNESTNWIIIGFGILIMLIPFFIKRQYEKEKADEVINQEEEI